MLQSVLECRFQVLCDSYNKYCTIIVTGRNFYPKLWFIITAFLMKILKFSENFYQKYWFFKELRLWNIISIAPVLIIGATEYQTLATREDLLSKVNPGFTNKMKHLKPIILIAQKFIYRNWIVHSFCKEKIFKIC